MSIQIDQTTQRPSPSEATVRLSEVVLSREELGDIANFPIRFPEYLPEGFSLQKIGGVRESGKAIPRSTDFFLHYGIGKGQWVMIQQTTDVQAIDMTPYTLIETIDVDGEEIAVYEKTANISGDFSRYHFQLGDVMFFVSTIGVSEDEMLKVVSSLNL